MKRALAEFLGGSVGCCRFLHFRPHLVTFRRHVQFDEYIKGGSQLFPLRPSREAKPSEGDLRITKRLVSAHEFFKSIFLDHVIVGQGFFSFQESRTFVITCKIQITFREHSYGNDKNSSH
jgi:hypothetical protein